jgi:hypothetical protein
MFDPTPLNVIVLKHPGMFRLKRIIKPKKPAEKLKPYKNYHQKLKE